MLPWWLTGLGYSYAATAAARSLSTFVRTPQSLVLPTCLA
jgi:hypothetical protein